MDFIFIEDEHLKNTVSRIKLVYNILRLRMDMKYVDMLTGENLSLIQVANIDLFYW